MALAVSGVVLVWPRPPEPRPPSAVTWAGLLAPLAPGSPVARDFVLGQPRRGFEHDLVLPATKRTSPESVEVHVVDKGHWDGVLETPSFGVAYEAPRSTAPPAESLAVTKAVWRVLREHDPGGLGTVDAIAIVQGEPPVPARLGRWPVRAWRLWTGGAAIAVATAMLATLPGGALGTSLWLFALGLLLRAPRLGLPFPIDQDVQRMFTGHLPLWQIVTGQGLNDRHPPLYFVVLHFAQWAGQSEAVGRAPAVLAGALVGPAVVVGAATAARARGAHVALAALAATISPVLVARSREVSEIPLFALIAIALCASYAAAIAAASRRHRGWVAASGALALYTYYLAPLVMAGAVVGGWLGRRSSRAPLRAVVVGTLVGVPALLLELRIFLRDQGPREAARLHPTFAWGEHGVSEMVAMLLRTARDAVGAPLLVVLAVVALAALVRRHAPTLVAAGGLAATAGGIALVAPVARVQPYYVVAVLPLAFLAVAVGLPRRGAAAAWLSAAVVGCATVAFGVPGLDAAQSTYQRSPDEWMSDVARVIDERPERTVLLTADYDSTLLAYDLARRHGVPMDWLRMRWQGDVIHLEGLPQVLEPLLRVHRPGPDPAGRALRLIDEATSAGDVLVVARDGLGLDPVDARLAGCERLFETPRGRLLVCRTSRR